MRRLFQAAAPTQGLVPTISILILCFVVASYVAGTLLWAAASGVDCHCWIHRWTIVTLAPPSPFQATALTQRLFQTLLLSTWLVLLGSYAAGMLLWVVASTAVSLANTRSITTTTIHSPPFFKLFIHLQLLLLVTCDHMDVWDVAALLPFCLIRVFCVSLSSKTGHDNISNIKPGHSMDKSPASNKTFTVHRSVDCFCLSALLQQLVVLLTLAR